jgi:hypothetical protein
MGWKAYNLAIMFKNKRFGVPFGFVLPQKVYEEKIKNKIIDTLIKEFKEKIEKSTLFKETVEDVLEQENIEEFISQRKVTPILTMLSKLPRKSGFGPDTIPSIVTKKLRRESKTQINTWCEILEEVKKEITNLRSIAVFIRSSSNIAENILKDYPGAFNSDAKTTSYLEHHQDILEKIFDIYLSLITSSVALNLYMNQPFEDTNMAILFQKKEVPLKSGIGKCKIKKEDGKVKLNVTVEAYEGELIVHVIGGRYKNKNPYLSFNPDKYSFSFICKKVNEKLTIGTIDDKEYKPGGHTHKLIFDLDESKFRENLASFDGDILTLKEQKKICNLMIDIFDFWKTRKPNLFGQKIEFIISQYPSIDICIVQCDNHTEG